MLKQLKHLTKKEFFWHVSTSEGQYSFSSFSSLDHPRDL